MSHLGPDKDLDEYNRPIRIPQNMWNPMFFKTLSATFEVKIVIGIFEKKPSSADLVNGNETILSWLLVMNLLFWKNSNIVPFQDCII